MIFTLTRTAIRLACISWLIYIPLQGQPLPAPPVINPEIQQGVEEIRPQIITHPGIVAWRDGRWLWSDHLFNLTRYIDVNVEYTSPDSMKSMVNIGKLEGEVEGIFKNVGISPYANPDPGKPDLPSFHLLILAHPVRDGYMFAIIARLFEPVQLERIKLDDRVTMQAITWERSSINVVQRADFDKELNATVKEIAKQFAERFQFFEKLRLQNK